MSYPRYFVDKISSIQPDPETGIVKLTFSVTDDGKSQDLVQLIVPVDALNKSFQAVGEKMQSTFGGGGPRPGGAGRPPQGGGRGPGQKNLKDLTER